VTDDAAPDEVQLAGVLERFGSRWCFRHGEAASGAPPWPVDVSASNGALVLGGWRLDDFVGIGPNDARVPRLIDIPAPAKTLEPEQLAVILLCGGLGSRSGGRVHPLLPIKHAGSRRTRTLLDLQLDRLAHSHLAGAKLLILGSLLNEAEIRQYLARRPGAQQPRLYLGGLVPRLTVLQMPDAPPLLYRDPLGHRSYNPAGHLDALRWLVGSGVLAQLDSVEVLMIASYSNWGRIFSVEALSLATRAAERSRRIRGLLFMVEVTPRPREKRTGSLLATRVDSPQQLRLVKFGYGQGVPNLPQNERMLMSTNTIYVSVAAFLRRLRQAAPAIGLQANPEATTRLLRDAATGRRRAEACALFDAAFPVEPLLTRKRSKEDTAVLQAERDLDQLSLLVGPSPLWAIEVGSDRAVSVKSATDLRDPVKQAALNS
jgi:UTP--glucose-1-phosphate uridylyltransferase